MNAELLLEKRELRISVSVPLRGSGLMNFGGLWGSKINQKCFRPLAG